MNCFALSFIFSFVGIYCTCQDWVDFYIFAGNVLLGSISILGMFWKEEVICSVVIFGFNVHINIRAFLKGLFQIGKS